MNKVSPMSIMSAKDMDSPDVGWPTTLNDSVSTLGTRLAMLEERLGVILRTLTVDNGPDGAKTSPTENTIEARLLDAHNTISGIDYLTMRLENVIGTTS